MLSWWKCTATMHYHMTQCLGGTDTSSVVKQVWMTKNEVADHSLWITRNCKTHGGPGAWRLAYHNWGNYGKRENQSRISFQHLAWHFEQDKGLSLLGSTTAHTGSKTCRTKGAAEMLQLCQPNADNFFSCLITMDECWVYRMTLTQRSKASSTNMEIHHHRKWQRCCWVFFGAAMVWC